MTIQSNSRYPACYPALNIVNYQIYGKYEVEAAHSNQIQTITKAAFDYLKHQNRPLARKYRQGAGLDEANERSLVEAVEKILISAHTPWKPNLQFDSPVEDLFFNLVRGKVPALMELIKQPALLKAVVWKKNPELLQEAQVLVQRMLEDIYNEMNSKTLLLTAKESLHCEIIVGDLLSLIPFLRPKVGSMLKIPLQIDDQWQLVEYQVEKIEITPKWMGSPYTAYGLNPNKELNHPPILLFKGTTYPTDKGFLISLLIDVNPFASVGSYGFHFGKMKIQNWLNTQTKNGKNGAIVYGKSLGGAQSWRTALYFPDLVKKVMAYGAPGFSNRDKKRLHNIQQHEMKAEINFFSQENDPVPLFDKASETGVNYYSILTNQSLKGILAHAHMYSTHENSVVLYNESFQKAKKWKRLGLSLSRVYISLIVFPIFLLSYGVYNMLNQTKKFLVKKVIGKAIQQWNSH